MSATERAIGLPLPDGAVITVGTFDGVHRGHHDVLTTLVRHARARGVPSVVITFDPHPLEVVNPAVAPLLLTLRDEKLALFAEAGVSYVAVLPFTATLAAFEAERFVDEVLLGRFAMRELLVGHDHGFGRGRMGDIDVLRTLGQSRDFQVVVLPPVHTADGSAISSTAIRQALAAGELERAALGLGRPYSISGEVVRGDQRGRTIGYPTLNLAPLSERKLLPPDGVYAVRVQLPEGAYGGMLNLGPRPTVGDLVRRIETHVFDAGADWYGARIRLDFVARLRGTRPFAGLDALKSQLAEDERQARALLATAEPTAALS
ncbi:MAG: bifunctional riboflavin kinase/FAD synthetase [Gemmatimonas sp.]|jgi:riboflavin kinase/FMN adenylyltransferase|uniref:bifunctional riboflavin kinase/FAD synthetase n=1 Tax=Gemmatimonas sp. TaxID=1962908 RepID=UPI0031BCBC4B|nr:bifunctional riboflavin kinase/FAD synthetase [Gemmatimonas sp.]